MVAPSGYDGWSCCADPSVSGQGRTLYNTDHVLCSKNMLLHFMACPCEAKRILLRLLGTEKATRMDPHNSREGLKEALADVEEGADIIMVKPALHTRT